jgi:ABC-2 type transport system permease protein
MRNVMVIAKREMRSYFDSPVAYIVLVTFLLVSGWMYFSALFLTGQADMRTFFAPSPFSPTMLLVVLAPAVTMRLIAEERKTGTLELLMTLPVSDRDVVWGKFLAAFGLLTVALSGTCVYAVTVRGLGRLDIGPVFTGYVGLLLFSASLLSVGLLCSVLTRNQIVAFIVGFLVCAALYFVYWLQFFLPQTLAPIVEFMSVSFHLDNLARGVIDTRDVLYYLTLTSGCLYMAQRALSRLHA